MTERNLRSVFITATHQKLIVNCLVGL